MAKSKQRKIQLVLKITLAVLGLFLTSAISYGAIQIYRGEGINFKIQTPELIRDGADAKIDSEMEYHIKYYIDWVLYENFRYGYEFKYPAQKQWQFDFEVPSKYPVVWHIADPIMAWYQQDRTSDAYTPHLEDYVFLTNFSQEEEESFLSQLQNYKGLGSAINHIQDVDGSLITIQPITSSLDQIQNSGDVPGFSRSEILESKNSLGFKVFRFNRRITWEMDVDEDVALIEYPYDNYFINGEKVTFLSLSIQRNAKNYNKIVFEEIVDNLQFFRIDSESGWKIYRNEEYGFEIQYPPHWQSSEYGLYDYKGERSSRPFISLSKDDFSIDVFIMENPDNLNSQDYVDWLIKERENEFNEGKAPHPYDYDAIKQIKINGMQAIELDGVFAIDHSEEVIFLAHGDKVYVFHFPVAEENPNYSNPIEGNRISHQMLGTFKFTD